MLLCNYAEAGGFSTHKSYIKWGKIISLAGEYTCFWFLPSKLPWPVLVLSFAQWRPLLEDKVEDKNIYSSINPPRCIDNYASRRKYSQFNNLLLLLLFLFVIFNVFIYITKSSYIARSGLGKQISMTFSWRKTNKARKYLSLKNDNFLKILQNSSVHLAWYTININNKWWVQEIWEP